MTWPAPTSHSIDGVNGALVYGAGVRRHDRMWWEKTKNPHEWTHGDCVDGEHVIDVNVPCKRCHVSLTGWGNRNVQMNIAVGRCPAAIRDPWYLWWFCLGCGYCIVEATDYLLEEKVEAHELEQHPAELVTRAMHNVPR